MCTKADNRGVENFINEFCEVLGIDAPKYEMKDLGPIDGEEAIGAKFTGGHYSIIVNVNYYKVIDRSEMARTLVHELFHAWEYRLAPFFMETTLKRGYYDNLYSYDGHPFEGPSRLAERGYDPREAYKKFVSDPDIITGCLTDGLFPLKRMKKFLEEVQAKWPEKILREMGL